MKNKKKFFNKNLYLEGLRQLKVIGILGIVVNLILAIGIPVGNYLSAKAEYRAYVTNNISEQFTKYAINAVDYHFYYLLFFLVFAPLMVIILFRFLNSRESCDFYHSLPHTRQCLFLSFSAAVVTWLAAQIFLVTAVSAVFYQIFSGYLILEFSRLFGFAVNILIASLLVISVLLLACALSGNTITELIVFFILFLTPRIFITIYQTIMTNALDYLASSMNSIFNIRNNLFYNILQALTYNSSAYIEVTSFGFSSVYTLCVAVLLFAAGYYFFTKRKSEAAESSMNNRILQTIFRTIFTMLLSMLPISMLFSYYTQRNIVYYQYFYDSTAMMIFYVVISYIAVILGMFLYELLTTKNAKSALRSLKSIPLIAALNAVVFVLLAASFGHYRDLRLNEDEIDSVNLVSMGHFYENDYYNQSSYFEAMISRYDFTDKELISLLCTSFNNYADIYSDYLSGKREDIYNLNVSSNDFYSLAVEFHGKSDYIFHLQLDTKTTDQFYKLLYSNQEFYNIYMNLPELTDKDTIYFSNAADMGISEEFGKELYESLRNELKGGEIEPEQWIKNADMYGSGIGFITINKYINSVYYELRLPINFTVPKTYKKLMDYYAETHTKDLEDFLDSLQTFENILLDPAHMKGDNEAYYEITGYDSINESTYSIYLSSMQESTEEYESDVSYLKKAAKLLREHAKSVSDMVSEEDILLYVRKEQTNYTTYESWNDFYILCIPVEIFKQIDMDDFEY